MNISKEVLNVLEKSEVRGNNLYLPPTQLERKLYTDVNKVLECLGGKWNRKEKAHIFPEDPQEAVDRAMLTGEATDAKKEFQFFETPMELATKLVEMADVKKGQLVLEPSTGKGRIAQALQAAGAHPVCIELWEDNVKELRRQKFEVTQADFMLTEPTGLFDRIVANPPFSKQQDVDHVIQMLKHLKPGGILVSVMSPSWQFRENKKSVAFRELLDELKAEVEEIPAGTFKESGTMIRSCIV